MSDDDIRSSLEKLRRLFEAPARGDSNSALAERLEDRSEETRELTKQLVSKAKEDGREAKFLRDEVDEKLEQSERVRIFWKNLLAAHPFLTIDVGRRLIWKEFRDGKIIAKIEGPAPALSQPLGKEVALKRGRPRMILDKTWDGNAGPRDVKVTGGYVRVDSTNERL